jgi:hypothetical protein
MAGRPTRFTQALGTIICQRIANGESLRSIGRDPDMPAASTILYWLLDEDKATFLEQYKVAKDIQADLMAEDIVDIADDGTSDYTEREREDGSTFEVVNTEHIQRSRLRVDARKWVASKLKPKKYGDKIDLTTDGEKLPTPLLPHALFNNNGNEEGSSAQ